MPRVLNVEQLETRFSSLTRARESIINLSSWIMHHSEFGEDIVEEWLAGLSKGFNALVMFYVANDVIMNCGKKRVPQFRTMFSKVLERTMALSNVKEISKDVLRCLKIWQERGIYSEEFCEVLLFKLNEEVKTIPDEPSKNEEKEEPADIISKYKKEHLFDKIIKLKHVAAEVNEKEEILKYADEPVMPRLQELAGSQECQAFLDKINRYYVTLKGFIKLSEGELIARNNVIKELNNSNIFYSSQHEDVKKVAHAYKIYGKKIKNVAKNLSVKIETLCESTTYISDNDTSSPKSPDDGFSPMDDSSACDSAPDTPKSINEISSLQSDKNIDVPSGTSSNRKLDQTSKLFQIWNEGQENTQVKVSNAPNAESDVHNDDNEMEGSLSELESSKLQNDSLKTESIPSIPSRSKGSKRKTENNGEITISEIMKPIVSKKECNQLESDENKLSQKGKLELVETVDDSKNSNTNNNKVVINEDSMSQDSTTKVEIVTKTIQEGTKEGLEEIDQLLEKTLKREKIKRKIEMLLKSKNKKHCSDIEGKQIFEECSLTIPDSQQIPAANSCSLKKSSQDKLQITDTDVPVSDISSKEHSKTVIPLDSEQINKLSSFLTNSSPENIRENCTNKNNFIGESGNTCKTLTNDSVMIVSDPKNKYQSCSNSGFESETAVTSKIKSAENLSLDNDTVLLGSYLSNELLKDILSKQKEISESSEKGISEVKNSAEKCEEDTFLNSTLQDSFFTTVFNSTTQEKSNLIPGLEISEEPKLGTDSVSSNIQSIKNLKSLSQKDMNNSVVVEKKEDVISLDLNKLEQENQTNSLSANEPIIKNGSPKQDCHFDDVIVNSDSKSNQSFPITNSPLKIDPETQAIESKEYVDNKLNVDEKKEVNKSKTLIKTLSDIFECLSKNKSHLAKESSYKNSREISLENCFLIYRASSLAADFCTTTNALHGPISSTFENINLSSDNPSNGIKADSPMPQVSGDNFQVADMDCDSE